MFRFSDVECHVPTRCQKWNCPAIDHRPDYTNMLFLAK